MDQIFKWIQDAVVRIIAAVKGRAALGGQRELRFQVINITVPNPTAANTTVEASVQLDREYNRIIGIGYFEIAAGGIADNYLVGAKSNRKTWIDDININAWDANANVGPMEKYIETDIPYGGGDTFTVRVTTGSSASSAAMSGQMVLILERSLTELPK